MPRQTTHAALRFQLLDPLRGVAALWVFTFHYAFSESFRQSFSWLMPIFRVGYLGVPMFFVISGYCLMASVRTAVNDSESVRSFLYRRALRIYPPFWCSVVVVAALPFAIEALSALKTGTFLRPTADNNINFGFLNYEAFDWLRVLTLTQVFAHVPNAANLQYKFTTINAVYWTLAIEFQFYIVMAVAVALRSRAAGWLVAVTAFTLPVWYLGAWTVVGIFVPYWPMFAVGILLYVVLESGVMRPRLGTLTSHTSGVVVTAVLIAAFAAWTIAGRQVSELGFAALFAVGLWFLHSLNESYRVALRNGKAPTRFTLQLIRHLGLMSYSLYLLHGRLQFLGHQLCRQLLPPGVALDVAAIATTCVMCYGFYLYCERPFIRSRVAAGERAPVVPSAVGAATAV
jgi:peptidoglycan/LPS O-acetylase OafA/YrhL